jgi:guanine deaminase
MRQVYRAALFHLLGDPEKDGPDAVQALDDGVLVIEDGHVAAAGSWDDLGPSLKGANVEKLDGVLVPGFIDCHVHYPQLGMIASPGARLLEWLSNYTFPMEERFADRQVAVAAAKLFLEQMLAHGTTSALVFATVHKLSAEALFEQALARNMRIISGKVLMDRGAPPGLCDTAETGYIESRALIRAWHGRGRLGYAVTPRFALTSTGGQLEMAGKLLVENPSVHMHTHLSENPEEVAAVQRLFPDCADYFGVYEKYGLAGDHSVFAHCIHLSDAEWGRLGKSGSNVAFCPTANLFLGSGLFDLQKAEGVGARVGLGTDVGAGTSLSLLQTMNEAYKVCQMRHRPVDALKLFYLATLGAARALRLDGRIGNFAPGKEADFVLLDSAQAPVLRQRLANAKSWAEKLFAFALLGDDRAVARTWVAGNVAYRRS